MEGPPLGPGGEDITWPDQVPPRGRKASSTRKIKPQTSNFCHTSLPVYSLGTAKGTDPKEFLMVLAPSVGSSKGHYQRIRRL